MKLRVLGAMLVAASIHLPPASALGEVAEVRRSPVRIVLPTAPGGSVDVLWQSGGAPPGESVASGMRLAAGFRVYVEAAGAASPMVGTYEVLPDRVRFTPRFPLREGTAYAVSFDTDCILAGTGACATATAPDAVFKLEAPRHEAARIAAVEPHSDRLPVNLLRFYVHFTEPMAADYVHKHITLLRADGTTVRSPFLNLARSLWDPEQKRLTVLLDPGRIKRGVGPNVEAGSPLVEGETYTLRVGAGLRDAHGCALARVFEKRFVVTVAVHERIDPFAWSMSPPASGSREPLRVATGLHLDSGRLGQTIRVLTETDERVAGDVALSPDEVGWQFTPAGAWRPGAYRIEIRTEIEDVSGNSVQSALDAPFGRAISLREEELFLPFVVSDK
ncbi:hypothetical protein OIU34_33145 [Pararhizobium sp. BT-229]|uniref:hypothetical protein n=1 Tax=Pararhizobium sp. BT-229 TaxID=2986923 RepID=UPI0021F6AF59|nr:hypothetical protein [Pararhizobium sp. BT-229]MCV9966725.1 hypothetical protein [Pararhizobium sp. BT-229]